MSTKSSGSDGSSSDACVVRLGYVGADSGEESRVGCDDWRGIVTSCSTPGKESEEEECESRAGLEVDDELLAGSD